ncbi:MAG TPA: hypothetical protein VEM41_02505 [Actinomycetota bacterium]|nr:hypothetical protein [Actinomycetota bacterium]
MRRSGPVATLLAISVALGLLSSCTSSHKPSDAPSTPRLQVVGTPTPPSPGQTKVKVVVTGGNAQYALGHTAYITDSGFAPVHLVAGVNKAVVFWNATAESQQIRFLNYGVPIASPVIPPGGSWAFKPNLTLSLIYVLVGRPSPKGYLQIAPIQPLPTGT